VHLDEEPRRRANSGLSSRSRARSERSRCFEALWEISSLGTRSSPNFPCTARCGASGTHFALAKVERYS
jgi:hypothetical protein